MTMDPMLKVDNLLDRVVSLEKQVNELTRKLMIEQTRRDLKAINTLITNGE